MQNRGIVFTAAAFLLTMSVDAHAYIDPGTGSVLTMAILGFFAAIAYTVRKYFYKLKDILTGNKPGGDGSRSSE